MKPRTIFVWCGLFLAISSQVHGARAFSSHPIEWFYAFNTAGAWSPTGKFSRIVTVTVSNVSNTAQQIRVTAEFRNPSFLQNALLDKTSSVRFGSNIDPSVINPLSAPAKLTQPGTGWLSLGAQGQPSDQGKFDFIVDYPGPAPNGVFLWVRGTITLKVEVLEDRGAITSGVFLAGGSAGAAPIINDTNSIASSSTQNIALNGGRAF